MKNAFKDEEFLEECSKTLPQKREYKTSKAPFLVKRSIDFQPYLVDKLAVEYGSENIEEMLMKLEGETIIQ